MSGYKSTTKSNPRLIGENINVNVTVIIVLYQEIGNFFHMTLKLLSGYIQTLVRW